MKKLLLCFSLLCLSFSSLIAQLKVSKIFSDHAVLQRNLEVPVWGTASPNATVIIRFNEQEITIQANEKGQWKAALPKMKAGGPHSLEVSTTAEKITFENILIGDVWLCSGQSNMEWPVAVSNNPAEEMAKATDDKIRHFKVPHSHNLLPQDTLAGGNWEVCSSETVGNFTAVGYYFARELRKHQDIPIGLLNSSWGGSRIEPWMRAETLGYENVKESAKEIQAYMDSILTKNVNNLKELIGELPEQDLGMKNNFPLWASTGYNHNNWKKMEIPGYWENKGYENLDGVLWFRKEIYLTKEEATSDITLSLGAIDDADITYFNGTEVGKTDQYNTNRRYNVPAKIIKEGLNVLTVRVTDLGWGGGFTGNCADIFYQTVKKKKALCGAWFFNIGEVSLNNTIMINQYPTLLYHQMIHPILKFPIKGALWYQGESNADVEGAKAYQEQFPSMIKDWRQLWSCGEFPFLWVQLANWSPQDDTNTNWARLREAQSMTLQTPNTAQAVIIDIGDSEDIHPRNKQDVGLRLSLAARKLAYQEEVVHSGPVYQKMSKEGDKIRLTFETFGSQLIAEDNAPLQSFSIAGSDQQFYPAQAKIEDHQIVVWSKQVPNPVAVRYAWINNPLNANLYNSEGLPADPFRTDDWD